MKISEDIKRKPEWILLGVSSLGGVEAWFTEDLDNTKFNLTASERAKARRKCYLQKSAIRLNMAESLVRGSLLVRAYNVVTGEVATDELYNFYYNSFFRTYDPADLCEFDANMDNPFINVNILNFTVFDTCDNKKAKSSAVLGYKDELDGKVSWCSYIDLFVRLTEMVELLEYGHKVSVDYAAADGVCFESDFDFIYNYNVLIDSESSIVGIAREPLTFTDIDLDYESLVQKHYSPNHPFIVADILPTNQFVVVDVDKKYILNEAELKSWLQKFNCSNARLENDGIVFTNIVAKSENAIYVTEDLWKEALNATEKAINRALNRAYALSLDFESCVTLIDSAITNNKNINQILAKAALFKLFLDGSIKFEGSVSIQYKRNTLYDTMQNRGNIYGEYIPLWKNECQYTIGDSQWLCMAKLFRWLLNPFEPIVLNMGMVRDLELRVIDKRRPNSHHEVDIHKLVSEVISI